MSKKAPFVIKTTRVGHMPSLRYTTKGARTFDDHPLERCPLCKSPLHNGFQLTCEPGVCRFREKPVYLVRDPHHRRAA